MNHLTLEAVRKQFVESLHLCVDVFDPTHSTGGTTGLIVSHPIKIVGGDDFLDMITFAAALSKDEHRVALWFGISDLFESPPFRSKPKIADSIAECMLMFIEDSEYEHRASALHSVRLCARLNMVRRIFAKSLLLYTNMRINGAQP